MTDAGDVRHNLMKTIKYVMEVRDLSPRHKIIIGLSYMYVKCPKVDIIFIWVCGDKGVPLEPGKVVKISDPNQGECLKK